MATSPDEKAAFWVESLAKEPPQIRFSPGLRRNGDDFDHTLDHIEFMTALMERHPLFLPFQSCSFGSELLDVRRALAYDAILRQLGHARSVIVNANAYNQIGCAVAIRCMLEMYAFVFFLNQGDTLQNAPYLSRLLTSRATGRGGWFDVEREWQKVHGEPIPGYIVEWFKRSHGAPRVGEFLQPLHETNQEFSFLYAQYSEYAHPIFGRPRAIVEGALGTPEPSSFFGSAAYYQALLIPGEPISLLQEHLSGASVCLASFWPLAYRIDPLFDESTRPEVFRAMKDQGCGPPPDIELAMSGGLAGSTR